jgi:hypothetical protein
MASSVQTVPLAMSTVVHGLHHVVSSRFGEYEQNRTQGLVGVVDLSTKVLVHLQCIYYIY